MSYSPVLNPQPVSGTFWQATQPVSGTVIANAGTGTFAVSAASLPLPTGAATSEGVATVNTTLGSPFQAGGSIGNTAFGISGTLPAFAATPTFNIGTAPTITTAPNITRGSGVIDANTQRVTLATDGMATTALTSIDGKTPALGQAAMAASSPVVIASNQSALNVSSDNVLDSLTTTASVTSATTVVSVATAGFNGGAFHVTSAGTTCTVSYEQSNDNTNWVALQVVSTTVSNVAPATTSTATGMFTYATAAAFVRARVSTYTSGTVTISLTQKRNAPPATNISLSSSGTSIGNITTVTAANIAAPLAAIVDVASAALTATTTTATITPSSGCSYEVNIPVTVVSGTTPTLDVVIEESDDSGTNWFGVYHFPRITATGTYRSPKLPLTGNRVRYVQTVAGTSPSFTRQINRVTSSDTAQPYRRIFDRSLNSTQALNSVTATMVVLSYASNLQLVIAAGAVTTTAPAIQIQGSEDGGVTWYNLGSPLTAVANSTVQVTVANVNAELVRGIVTTAGVLATLTSIALKAF